MSTGTDSAKHASPDDINSNSFDPDHYMNLMVHKSNLEGLLQRHVKLGNFCLFRDNLKRANGQIFNVRNPDNEVSVKELVELMIQVATIAWLEANSVCGSHSVAIPLVLVLPYLFRLNQCLRQYKDTGEKTCLLNDYKPFVQHVGIPSIDIAFGGEFLVPKREASVRISLCQNFLYIKNAVASSNLTP
ncbi:hypothetical protein AHAS_Ahas14G0076200 [Arachis hypogaea]